MAYSKTMFFIYKIFVQNALGASLQEPATNSVVSLWPALEASAVAHSAPGVGKLFG